MEFDQDLPCGFQYLYVTISVNTIHVGFRFPRIFSVFFSVYIYGVKINKMFFSPLVFFFFFFPKDVDAH